MDKCLLEIPFSQVGSVTRIPVPTLSEMCLRKVCKLTDLEKILWVPDESSEDESYGPLEKPSSEVPEGCRLGLPRKQIIRALRPLLPEVLLRRLESGPVAFCHNCHYPLFDYAMIRVHEVRSREVHPTPRMLVVSFCCSKFCLQMFRAEDKFYREVRWRDIRETEFCY